MTEKNKKNEKLIYNNITFSDAKIATPLTGKKNRFTLFHVDLSAMEWRTLFLVSLSCSDLKFVTSSILDAIQKQATRLIDNPTTDPLETLTHQRSVSTLFLFYRTYQGLCSDEIISSKAYFYLCIITLITNFVSITNDWRNKKWTRILAMASVLESYKQARPKKVLEIIGSKINFSYFTLVVWKFFPIIAILKQKKMFL